MGKRYRWFYCKVGDWDWLVVEWIIKGWINGWESLEGIDRCNNDSDGDGSKEERENWRKKRAERVSRVVSE